MNRSKLMKSAWRLAYQGARNFGGSVKLYFACALKLCWEDFREKPQTAWTPGIGNRFVLPGVPLPTSKAVSGRFVLPGMHLQ